MTLWLVNFKQHGRKFWTTVEASSIQKACDKLHQDGDVINILHIEAIEDNEPVIKEENWDNDKILF
jgi:hypothetical protein